MQEAVSDILARRRADPDGLGRLMSQSIAIHVLAVVLVFVVPKDWISRDKEKPILMTISLGGSLGERSGGMVAAGARPVEQVKPPPPRPEPIRPAAKPEPERIAVPTKTPPKATPKPSEPTTGATSPLTRPATGAQLQRGTAVADTGSTSQQTGLTFGGGAGGASVTLEDTFCCKEYITEMIRRIQTNWDKVQPESGTVTVVFEINRDGTFTKPEIERDKSSGSTALRVASTSAFAKLQLPPLPKEYPADKLKIHLTFPYVR